MLSYRTILFLYFTSFFMFSCASSAQMNGIKVVEENQERKYTQIKTAAFKRNATILEDTTDEFNRYPSTQAAKQYIPLLTDVQAFEDTLKNSFVFNEQIVDAGEPVAKHYKKFNRQYSGYIDRSGDTILIVCFLDFSNRKKANKFFNNWKYRNGYLGSGLFLDSSPPHIYCYSFNLRTGSVSRYKV